MMRNPALPLLWALLTVIIFLAPTPALAHPGHANAALSENMLAHYLLTPSHCLPMLIVVLMLVVVWFKLSRACKLTSPGSQLQAVKATAVSNARERL
ncbi:MAG: hypothetical protein AAF483_19880 [Planctomycetota bacterium]